MPRTLALSCLIVATLAAPLKAADISKWSVGTNGTITWDDLDALRRQVFDTFDKNGDGVLDTEEYDAFDAARAAAAKKSPSSLLLRAVSGLGRENTDLNLDGLVTRNEMETSLRSWLQEKDKNNDGIIGVGEF